MGQARVRKQNGTITDYKTKIEKPSLPHYTVDTVLPMFSSGAAVEIAGETVVPLSSQSGLLKYSDVDGGTAYLVHPETYKKLASFNARITDEMRKRKCEHPDCKCKEHQLAGDADRLLQ